MTDDKDLGKELLKRNGIEPGQVSEERRRELRAAVERDKRRARRMKWATVVAWSLLALLYIASGFPPSILAIIGLAPLLVTLVVHHPHPWMPYLLLPVGVLFWVAVVCTVSWYVRSRFVRDREIQANLADITEQLRQLVEDQKADRAKGTSAPGPEPKSETKRD